MLKLCYFKGKAIFFLSCYTPQFIGFGFLKFGFQFIVLEQYIKSYIYKYIYYILYTNIGFPLEWEGRPLHYILGWFRHGLALS